MYSFFKEIFILFILTILFGELICRSFPIVPDIPVRINKEGFYMLKENQSGNYIRGKFPKWLSSKYKINNLGFISSKDYFFDDNNEFKIAIIGDSFVEGFQVDSDKSIGRLLENNLEKYEVYEFGFSGYNFFNYVELYKKFNLEHFKYVFIVIDANDLQSKRPEKNKFTDEIRKKELIFRKVYDNLYFFKYLNWNHNLISKIRGILDIFHLKKGINKDINSKFVDITSFSKENPNTSWILKSKSDSFLKDIYPNLSFIEINHERIPFNFGYDQHWNLNGKYNVAETITKWINQKKK